MIPIILDYYCKGFFLCKICCLHNPYDFTQTCETNSNSLSPFSSSPSPSPFLVLSPLPLPFSPSLPFLVSLNLCSWMFLFLPYPLPNSSLQKGGKTFLSKVLPGWRGKGRGEGIQYRIEREGLIWTLLRVCVCVCTFFSIYLFLRLVSTQFSVYSSQRSFAR